MTHHGLDHRGGLATERIRPDQTLIARIGGRPVVDRIVNGLYSRIEADPSLRPMFIRDIAAEREKQKDFWEEWLGGEPRHTWHHAYSGLQQRHAHIHITRNAAHLWLRYLEEALEQALESQGLVDEVLAIARPIALSLVNETTPAARAGDLRCHRVRPFRVLKTMAGKGDTAGLMSAIHSNPAFMDDPVEMAAVIQMAATKGRTETVDALIDVGVDPNRAAHFKEGCITQSLMLTPLCVALVKNHVATAGCLRERGAVYDIFTAAYLGERPSVVDFLERDPNLANTDDPANDVLSTTPLHHAVYGGHFVIVELLLAAGATVGRNSTTMVRHAANEGDLALTRLLVDNAADATRVGPGPWVVHDRIADLLLARGADVNYPAGEWIWRSCTGNNSQRDNPELVGGLIDRGADITTLLRNRTALHYTGKAGFLQATRVLLDRGSDPNALTVDGETPLSCAFKAGKRADVTGMCKLLLAAGADPCRVNQKGTTPRQMAARLKRADRDDILSVLG